MDDNAAAVPSTHWKDDRYAAAYGLATVQRSLLAHPQVLAAITVLPAGDGGAVQQDLDALAGGQAGGDLGVVCRDVDRRLGRIGDGRNGGRLVGAVDHAGQEVRVRGSRRESSKQINDPIVR